MARGTSASFYSHLHVSGGGASPGDGRSVVAGAVFIRAPQDRRSYT
jgi:hypothetical protein